MCAKLFIALCCVVDKMIVRGANSLLVFFQNYLGNRALGHEPPVSIKAADLDRNFRAVTLIDNPDEDGENRSYTVDYRQEGTVLAINRLPDGATKGDLLYWDPEQEGDGAWVVLPAPSSTALRVLTLQNGTLAWTATEECE
jgi:hypothetical protein